MHPAHQPLFFAEPGALAPLFHAKCGANPRYAFGSAAGRYVLLLFMGSHEHPLAKTVMQKVANCPAFDDEKASCFAVWADGKTGQSALSQPRLPGIRHFDDNGGKVFQLYRLGKPINGSKEMRIRPLAVVCDPMLRVLRTVPLEQIDEALDVLMHMPPPYEHAGTSLHPPVLVVPRVFEEEFCQELMAHYEKTGAEYSGVMSEKNGQTVYVENPSFKVRFDCQIGDEDLRNAARQRVERRLVPILHRSLNFKATRMERYIVACYTKEKGGFFLPHRDNTTKGTAHRSFAVTINLNTGDYEGGGLRFPEFSDEIFVAPRGGAVVFGCCLLHEALPVTKGNRMVFLPFLYDEAGAQLRAQNAEFLADNVPKYGDAQAASTA
ncbi:MAG: 2OG-Fe(II) oxygenase [Pseudomonadota bacterium]